jgi:ABC-type branched-subunit amino acid transport system substrate-binding protein
MNKTAKIIIGIVVIIIIIWVISSSRKSTVSDTIKIGVVSFPTGPAAAFAKISLNGISLAVDDINKTGGINGRKVETVIEDYAYDSKRARMLVNSRYGTRQKPQPRTRKKALVDNL